MPELKLSADPEVVLWAYIQVNPDLTGMKADMDELASYAARGCHTKTSAVRLWLNQKRNNPHLIIDKVEDNLSRSAKIAHRSVMDQSAFMFSIDNLPRAATMQLCLPQYPMHLQQSMRFVDATKGFYVPPNMEDNSAINIINVTKEAYSLYNNMNEDNSGIKTEDARYITQLCARTAITTTLNASSLVHLNIMSDRPGVPDVVKYVPNQMLKLGRKVAPLTLSKWENTENVHNWEPHLHYSSQQMFARTNKLMNKIIAESNFTKQPVYIEHKLDTEDKRIIEQAIINRNEAELSVLKHLHNNFTISGYLMPISLAGNHQLIRQRTLDLASESIYDAIERAVIVVPPSIQRNDYYFSKYIDLNERIILEIKNAIDNGARPEDAILFAPNSLVLYQLLHVNGFNMFSAFMKDRLCRTAQWEIRNAAWSIKNILAEKDTDLGDLIQPKSKLFGSCPELKPCPNNNCPTYAGTDSKIFYKLNI